MRNKSLILFGLAAIVFAIVLAQSVSNVAAAAAGAGNEAAAAAAADNNSDNVELAQHKLFDFARFKKLFNKSYSSLAEELARQKIFLARAFKAFLSFVSFKHNKSTSYMGLNDLSDWTLDEFKLIEVRRPIEPESVVEESKSVRNKEQEEESAADMGDIEAKLREIVQHKDENPTYAKIAEELSESNIRVKRSSGESNKRSISLDSLLEEQKPVEVSEKLIATIPSNNEHYQPPELDSYGADDGDNKPTPMSDLKASIIKSLPGAQIVGTMLEGASELLFGQTKPKEIIRNNLPDELNDLRATRCFTPIKHQGRCGSCYIFSTVALYEYKYCRETGKLVSFSEQYPVSCGSLLKLGGCHGGQETDVGKFFGLYGIELTHNWPYTQREDVCPYEKRTPPKSMGYLKVNEPKLRTIDYSEFDSYIKEHPILLGFGVSTEFHMYKGGIDDGRYCDRNRGHSMLVVGSGRQRGIDYWIVRNSYGAYWGERGYYRIAKQAKNCFLDRGMGWVLPKEHKVFGSVNGAYNSKIIQDQLSNQNANQLQDYIKNHVTHFDPNIATPSSLI